MQIGFKSTMCNEISLLIIKASYWSALKKIVLVAYRTRAQNLIKSFSSIQLKHVP